MIKEVIVKLEDDLVVNKDSLEKLVEYIIEKNWAIRKENVYYITINCKALQHIKIARILEEKSTLFVPNYKPDGDSNIKSSYEGTFVEYKSYNGVEIKLITD